MNLECGHIYETLLYFDVKKSGKEGVSQLIKLFCPVDDKTHRSSRALKSTL